MEELNIGTQQGIQENIIQLNLEGQALAKLARFEEKIITNSWLNV